MRKKIYFGMLFFVLPLVACGSGGKDTPKGDKISYDEWQALVNGLEAHEYESAIVSCSVHNGSGEHDFVLKDYEFTYVEGQWTPAEYGYLIKENSAYNVSQSFSYLDSHTIEEIVSFYSDLSIYVDGTIKQVTPEGTYTTTTKGHYKFDAYGYPVDVDYKSTTSNGSASSTTSTTISAKYFPEVEPGVKDITYSEWVELAQNMPAHTWNKASVDFVINSVSSTATYTWNSAINQFECDDPNHSQATFLQNPTAASLIPNIDSMLAHSGTIECKSNLSIHMYISPAEGSYQDIQYAFDEYGFCSSGSLTIAANGNINSRTFTVTYSA